jgi:acyl-CoA synthetase (AMP-forming)/AMP-acid ligase II
MATYTHGATTVMIETFVPLVVLASIQKEKCTALYGVPTMFIAELNHPMFDMFDLSSLRTGIMAGSPCPIETMRQVIDKMHMTDVTIAYGLTEGSPVMTQTRTDDPIEVKVGIEEFLYQVPGIQDVQVAGVPSSKYGEQVGAFIILKNGMSMEEEEVQDYCRGQIARFKIPKYIFFLDDMFS